MSSERREDRIQDYLDDRLDPAGRAAFEAEMAADPALAKEVGELRAVGEVVRSLDAPLPDGFHGRARDRFARERGRGRHPRFPWEALGLAAAALILGAILIPWSAFGPSPAPSVVDDGDVAAPETVAKAEEALAPRALRESDARQAPVAVALHPPPAPFLDHRADGFVPLAGPQALAALLRGPEGTTIRALGTDLDWRHLGTVTGPADCAGVRLEPSGAAVRVVVPAGPDPVCLVRIPSVASPVTVVREPER